MRWAFGLSILGTLFAVSVTARQYLAPTNEPGIFSCVGLKIFGLSPCPYGLAFFLLLAILSGSLLTKPLTLKAVRWFQAAAVAGTIYAGWIVYRELVAPALALGSAWWDTFQLARVPACAWGFLVFIAVLVLALNLKPTAPVNDNLTLG